MHDFLLLQNLHPFIIALYVTEITTQSLRTDNTLLVWIRNMH